VSFGLLKTDSAVALRTDFFSGDTVMLNNGFDWVKGIDALRA
jgi:hypothetical protein